MPLSIDELIADKIQFAKLKAEGKVPSQKANINRSTIVPEHANCGNCSHCYYTSMNEVTFEFGRCELYQLSERTVNRPTAKACPYWHRKSEAKHHEEMLYSSKMTAVILAISPRGGGRTMSSKEIEASVMGREIVKKTRVSAEQNINKAKNALAELGIGVDNTFIEDEEEQIEVMEDEE